MRPNAPGGRAPRGAFCFVHAEPADRAQVMALGSQIQCSRSLRRMQRAARLPLSASNRETLTETSANSPTLRCSRNQFQSHRASFIQHMQKSAMPASFSNWRFGDISLVLIHCQERVPN